mmetsp:Transcript_29466/g.44681  ORF Transcript_29466/g.44681 Transcript_29466/m.44681 type:complete len:258 (+) Transcript_29466:549-1322(+)
MGCLDLTTFLVNNPNLKISGVIAGSPFWGLSDSHNIDFARRLIIKFLATFVEELPLNGLGSTHYLSHDRRYYLHELVTNSKKHPTYTSGGILNSMLESCEDISVNAKVYTKPTLVFMAGKDKIVNNGAIRNFIAKCGVPKPLMKIRLYPNSYHNIHKEPEYKFRQLAEIYEFIHALKDAGKTMPFEKGDLKKVRFGRPLKKKSLKVKRSFTTALIISYLYYGVLILIIRGLIRRWNEKNALRWSQVLFTIMIWPKYI